MRIFTSLKTKANNKCFCISKMYIYRATEKHKWVRAIKSKAEARRDFKVDPVLKLRRPFISRLNLCDQLQALFIWGSKGVFTKNERGYMLTSKNIQWWMLLILLLSVASIWRKLLTTTHKEKRSVHTNSKSCNNWHGSYKINLFQTNHSDISTYNHRFYFRRIRILLKRRCFAFPTRNQRNVESRDT